MARDSGVNRHTTISVDDMAHHGGFDEAALLTDISMIGDNGDSNPIILGNRGRRVTHVGLLTIGHAIVHLCQEPILI